MAISKELFRTLIKEGQEYIEHLNMYARPFDFEKNGRYVLVGVRQAGKSYMLCRRARQLLGKGYSLDRMVYIDFDDERLIGMKADELDLILQAYGSVSDEQPVLFFDEIQNVEGWEHFARRLANRKYQVFISGSNAKMLSRDIQTTLGSRYIDAYIYPYSFREYLGASGVKLGRDWAYGKQKNAVQQAFATFMQWGGFPELLLFGNKRGWLNDLYEKIVLGDIIQRNRIKNELGLRLTIKRVAENVMQPVSYNRLSNMLKAGNVAISVSTIAEYIGYAKDACVLFSVSNYASKFSERETIKKHYFIDNGLLSIFLNGGDCALLENLCATHLYRTYRERLFYFNRNVEVDFFVPDEGYAVQASYSVFSDDSTRQRETAALIKLNERFQLKRMVIVTCDEEGTIDIPGGGVIEVVPAWKWLLEG